MVASKLATVTVMELTREEVKMVLDLARFKCHEIGELPQSVRAFFDQPPVYSLRDRMIEVQKMNGWWED